MQPTRPNRAAYAKRPLWRNYLFAYLLIGVGASIGSVAVGPSGNRIVEAAGATLLFIGLLVFVAALGHSFWFVAGGKPPRNGAA